MLPDTTPLRLNEDDREVISRVVIERILDAVAGATERDNMLAQLDDQLEGRSAPTSGRKRWRNSCSLEDPITREMHTQVTAQFQSSDRDPFWQVAATSSADKPTAQKQELFLSAKKASDGLDREIYNLRYNAARDPAAVLYAGWKQILQPQKTIKWRNRETGVEVEDGQQMPGFEYDPVQREEQSVSEQGMDYRTVDLVDWYPYPANARSIEQAIGVGERIRFTEEELLAGIDDYGFDEDMVETLIGYGPTHAMDGTEFYANGERDDAVDAGLLSPYSSRWGSPEETRENRIDGVRQVTRNHRDGIYECFLFFSRCPCIRDTDGSLIDFGVDRHRYMMFLCCPQYRVTFKMDYSPYSQPPYFLFSMLFRPNRLQGLGVCQMLASIQVEATARLRNTIDGADLETSPTVIVPASQYKNLSKFGVYPGCMLPEDIPNSIRVLQWTQSSQIGWQQSQQLRNMAQSVISARGFGQINEKQPLVAEMQGIMAATDTKFDLFLFCFNITMADLAPWIIQQYAKNANEATTLQGRNGEDIEITIEDLEKTFRYIPAATSQSSNPQIQLGQAMKKMEVTTNYFQAIQVMPQHAPQLWHAAREVLVAIGEPDPDAYLGAEPQPMMMPGAMPGMPQMGEAQQGQVSPQMLMQMIQGGGVGNGGY